MFENLINVLFPKVCSGCSNHLLSNENVICTICRHEIPLTNHHLNPENEALKKFYGKIPVEFASTLVYFHKKGIVQEMIHNLKINYNPNILSRSVYSKTQVKKNLLNRTEVLEHIFDVQFSEKEYNKHFLLIDDVLTTGSTLEACGRALLKIPGAKISIVCMAMSHS